MYKRQVQYWVSMKNKRTIPITDVPLLRLVPFDPETRLDTATGWYLLIRSTCDAERPASR